LIANYTENTAYNPGLFRKDGVSVLYAEEMTLKLNAQWTDKWLTMVLDTIGFLSDESISTENTRILESLMTTIDAQTQKIFLEQFQGGELDGFIADKKETSTVFEEANPMTKRDHASLVEETNPIRGLEKKEREASISSTSTTTTTPPLANAKQKGSKN
jgi:hypothetical protein